MPIYEYRCGTCGFQREYLQKMSDAPLTVCPECGKPSFSKMVTAAGFQLKGSGWYATDFKHGPKAKETPAAKAGDKPAASASGETAAKSDAKPAEAPAKKTEAAVSTAGTGAGASAASS